MIRVYCLDSNALIEPWNKYYTMENCAEYWEIIDRLALQGRVFCTLEVKHEIAKIDDSLAHWVEQRPYLFREESAQANANIRQILAQFPRLIDSSKGRSMADPWVVAHAMAEGAVVVTKEFPTPTDANKIKIPNVCEAFGVEWMSDFQFNNELGIKFSASIDQRGG